MNMFLRFIVLIMVLNRFLRLGWFLFSSAPFPSPSSLSSSSLLSSSPPSASPSFSFSSLFSSSSSTELSSGSPVLSSACSNWFWCWNAHVNFHFCYIFLNNIFQPHNLLLALFILPVSLFIFSYCLGFFVMISTSSLDIFKVANLKTLSRSNVYFLRDYLHWFPPNPPSGKGSYFYFSVYLLIFVVENWTFQII